MARIGKCFLHFFFINLFFSGLIHLILVMVNLFGSQIIFRQSGNSPSVCVCKHWHKHRLLAHIQEPLQTRCLKPSSGPRWRLEPCTPQSLWDPAQVHRAPDSPSRQNFCVLPVKGGVENIFQRAAVGIFKILVRTPVSCDVRELSSLFPKNEGRKESFEQQHVPLLGD